jgi:hypothetical protein
MAMPNRSNEVKAIAPKYPQAFGPSDDTMTRGGCDVERASSDHRSRLEVGTPVELAELG